MPCFHPIRALRSAGGVTILPPDAKIFNLKLPCGRCDGCLLERSRQWAVRCVHEASQHTSNCFVTLTYDDDNLPADCGLNHAHFQLFMKRLRSSVGFPVRFYMAGEYGSVTFRPHYHALLFGYRPNDLVLHKLSPSGENLYVSKSLAKLWRFGFVSIGDVNFKSACYVSRYIMKKQYADSSYRCTDSDTGEVCALLKPYNRMSLKPGIGASWFDKFTSDVFPHDRVVLDGVESKPPRYYDKRYASTNSDKFDFIKSNRMLDIVNRLADNTDSRLLVRETVLQASISKFKRSL